MHKISIKIRLWNLIKFAILIFFWNCFKIATSTQLFAMPDPRSSQCKIFPTKELFSEQIFVLYLRCEFYKTHGPHGGGWARGSTGASAEAKKHGCVWARRVKTRLVRCECGMRSEKGMRVVSTSWASGALGVWAWWARENHMRARVVESVRGPCPKTSRGEHGRTMCWHNLEWKRVP